MKPTIEEMVHYGCIVGEDYIEQDGELNMTKLAEAIADHFDMDGALDDETHELWEVVYELASSFENIQ